MTFDPITPCLAYVGPGGALSAIGSFLALVGAILLAVIGFVWYPVKRLMRKRRAQRQGRRRSAQAPGTPACELGRRLPGRLRVPYLPPADARAGAKSRVVSRSPSRGRGPARS